LFYHHYDQIPDRNSIKEEVLILLMVSEDLVQGHLAPCFWAHGEAGEHVEEEAVHLMVDRKQ
jgi:hypothetical protein